MVTFYIKHVLHIKIKYRKLLLQKLKKRNSDALSKSDARADQKLFIYFASPYADFKNAYFYILILLIFRVMASFRPKKARFGENGLFRLSDGNNSKNLQDRNTKVYIFEISAKFCVDW